MGIKVATLSYLATLWRVPVRTAIDAARGTGVKPVLEINGLAHYRDLDAATMLMWLANRDRLPEGV